MENTICFFLLLFFSAFIFFQISFYFRFICITTTTKSEQFPRIMLWYEKALFVFNILDYGRRKLVYWHWSSLVQFSLVQQIQQRFSFSPALVLRNSPRIISIVSTQLRNQDHAQNSHFRESTFYLDGPSWTPLTSIS